MYTKSIRLEEVSGQIYAYHNAELPEIEDLDLRETELLQEPLILLVSRIVLVGSQRMSDAVDVIDDRTSQVVSRVRLVFIASQCQLGLIRYDSLIHPVM